MVSDAACAVPLGSCCCRWFCCLGDIPITVHWTFFLLLGAQIWVAIDQYSEFWYTLLIAVVYGPVLLITVLGHEWGHAWMNARFGGETERIVLWPLGGYVILGRTEGVSVMEDFWVALAGPLMHVVMGAAWFGIYGIFESYKQYQFEFDASWDFDQLSTWDGFLATMAEQAMFLNVGLFIFNLLIPAYPLDGGRILAALLVSFCCCSIQCAAYLTAGVALLLAAAMVYWAVDDLIIDDNDDADGGAPVILLLIAVWIIWNSLGLLRHALSGRAVDHALFNKQCYRDIDAKRSNNGRGSNDDFGAPPPSSFDEEKPPKTKSQRKNKKNKKKNANDEEDEDDAEEPTHTTPVVGNQDLPPQPIDVELSPAGAGASWTTFQTPVASEPPPALDDDKDKKKSGRGLGRLFSKKSRPSQSANDDDFVV